MESGVPISIALVCNSNVNRSMEAHRVLKREEAAGIRVNSYGVSSKIRLPGKKIDQPNVYDFGTPFRKIYEDLARKDRSWYTRNGILEMIGKDSKVKIAPERWIDKARDENFDLVICYDMRAFDLVSRDYLSRRTFQCRPVHVFGLAVPDKYDQAKKAAAATVNILRKLLANPDWNGHGITDLIQTGEREWGVPMCYRLCFN